MSNESSAYKLLDKSEFLGHYQYIQNCASWLSDKELLISFKSNVVLMILDPYGLQCSDMKCPHFERNFSFEKLPYRSLRSRVDKISLIGADWHEKLIAVLSLDGQIVIFDPYTGLTEYGIFLHTPKLLKYYLTNKSMFHKTYLDSMKQERIPTIDIFVNESLNMYNVSKLLAVSKITLAGESLYAYTHCSVLKIRLSDGKIITNNSVAEVVKLTERNFGMAASKNEVLLAYNSKMIQFLANLRDSTDLLIVMRQLLLCKKIPGTVWKWMIKRMNEMKIQWSHSLKILRFCCVVMTQRKIISMQYVKCWKAEAAVAKRKSRNNGHGGTDKTWIPRIGRVCEDGHLINFCNITFQCLPTSACLHCIRCGAIASTAIKSPAMIELFGDTVCPYCDGTFITSSIS
ncbi:hypothetical protein T12_4464 [Trichinella patagoniensis]|uniref:Uncharacterized protein n=1 Tax=Trichinella patagoniensis TaxID=990121 RepID=A0A0V0ZP18_9BILA|nr:hypothetical protein T12_4464 [Trichinella patagoniensis]